MDPNELDDVVAEFVVESKEHLDDVETKLLRIEQKGEDIDSDLVNEVFRAIHSVKGAAGFLGFKTLGDLAHALESVLDRIRQRDLVPQRCVVEALLEGTDRLVQLLGAIDASNGEDVSKEIARLQSVLCADPEADILEDFDKAKDLLATIDEHEREGRNAWTISIPVQACCLATDREPEGFFRHLRKHGDILDGEDEIRFFLAKSEPSREEIRILFATDLPIDDLCSTLGIDEDCLVPAFNSFEPLRLLPSAGRRRRTKSLQRTAQRSTRRAPRGKGHQGARPPALRPRRARTRASRASASTSPCSTAS